MQKVIDSDMKLEEELAPAFLPVPGLFNPRLHPLNPLRHPLTVQS